MYWTKKKLEQNLWGKKKVNKTLRLFLILVHSEWKRHKIVWNKKKSKMTQKILKQKQQKKIVDLSKLGKKYKDKKKKTKQKVRPSWC